MPFVPKHRPLLWLVAARRHLAVGSSAAAAVQWEHWVWILPPAMCDCLHPAHEHAMSLDHGAEITNKLTNYPSGSRTLKLNVTHTKACQQTQSESVPYTYYHHNFYCIPHDERRSQELKFCMCTCIAAS